MTTALGLPGYTFEDLHRPDRLASLYDRFCEEVRATDPAFWLEWEAYRHAPDAPRPPLALSNLLTGMAPHVSRFLQRLFDVDAPAEAIAESTRAQDDLFRFKVDFVRRRALPLLKGGARVSASAEDDAIVERMIADQQTSDRELAVARAGCALLDRRENRRAPSPSVPHTRSPETLVRRTTPRSRLSQLGNFPVSRNTRLLEPRRSAAARAAIPRRRCAVRTARLRRRDGFGLTDPRFTPRRESLSEIHYCVLLPRARQGLVLEGTSQQGRAPLVVNPLGIALDGCPLDEKISEMHALRKRWRRGRRARAW